MRFINRELIKIGLGIAFYRLFADDIVTIVEKSKLMILLNIYENACQRDYVKLGYKKCGILLLNFNKKQ